MGDIRNGIVRKTFLGYEDHGILTANIEVEMSSGRMKFGNLFLDDGLLDPEDYGGPRKAHIACGVFIGEVLRICGRDSWEKLAGAPVRVEVRDSYQYALGAHMKEDWLVLKDWRDIVRQHDPEAFPDD